MKSVGTILTPEWIYTIGRDINNLAVYQGKNAINEAKLIKIR